MKLQENPDGVNGHEEREQYQKESKSFPVKKKFIGKREHYYTKPPTAPLNEMQRKALLRLDMKENCDDYNEECEINSCLLCAKRDGKRQEIIARAKTLIEEYENKLGMEV